MLEIGKLEDKEGKGAGTKNNYARRKIISAWSASKTLNNYDKKAAILTDNLSKQQ